MLVRFQIMTFGIEKGGDRKNKIKINKDRIRNYIHVEILIDD